MKKEKRNRIIDHKIERIESQIETANVELEFQEKTGRDTKRIKEVLKKHADDLKALKEMRE